MFSCCVFGSRYHGISHTDRIRASFYLGIRWLDFCFQLLYEGKERIEQMHCKKFISNFYTPTCQEKVEVPRGIRIVISYFLSICQNRKSIQCWIGPKRYIKVFLILSIFLLLENSAVSYQNLGNFERKNYIKKCTSV